MGVPILRKFAAVWGIALRHCDGSLFAVLVIIILALLGCSEEELLDILLLRLVKHVPAWAVLHDMEDIGDVLEHDEVREMQAEMEDDQAKESDAKKYAKNYWKRRRAHNAARRAADGHAGGGGRPRTRWPAAVPENDICQADMRTHMPERSHIWRNNVSGCWCIHVGPFYRSFAWSRGGPLDSGREACQAAWKLHLMTHGEGLASCTVDDLFPVGTPELASAPAAG